MEQDSQRIPSHVEIEAMTERFLALMKQREVGVASYLEARRNAAVELYEALGKVLGR